MAERFVSACDHMVADGGSLYFSGACWRAEKERAKGYILALKVYIHELTFTIHIYIYVYTAAK